MKVGPGWGDVALAVIQQEFLGELEAWMVRVEGFDKDEGGMVARHHLIIVRPLRALGGGLRDNAVAGGDDIFCAERVFGAGAAPGLAQVELKGGIDGEVAGLFADARQIGGEVGQLGADVGRGEGDQALDLEVDGIAVRAAGFQDIGDVAARDQAAEAVGDDGDLGEIGAFGCRSRS